MLQIIIPPGEQYDEINNEFIVGKGQVLHLEHSLVSLSKWESKWEKPFLSKIEKTDEETINYIHCMTITQNVDDSIYKFLTQENINQVNAYVSSPMTATTFSNEEKKATNGIIITAEIIYYWMITFNIPFECQKWHLNRLLTLINVCSIKNQPEKKMSKREQFAQNQMLNAQRKAKLHTRG